MNISRVLCFRVWFWMLLLSTVIPCDSFSWFNPIRQKASLDVYKSSRNDRIDYIFKELTKEDLDGGTPLTEEVKSEVRKSAVPGDIIAAILDQKLGGLGNETSNAIAMNPATEEHFKTKVLKPINDFLTTNTSWEKLTFEFLPVYESENSTRPYGFGVAAVASVYHYRYAEFYIVKGYIPNPTASISDMLNSYTYNTSSVFSSTGLESYEYGIEEDYPPYTRRVEKASKYVLYKNILRGANRTETEQTARNRTALIDIKDSDVAGQLISNKFDSGNSTYNIVPMDPRSVEEFKKRLESPIIDYFNDTVNRYNLVRIDIHVVYENRIAIRPVGFVAHIRKSKEDTGEQIVHNHFISNY